MCGFFFSFFPLFLPLSLPSILPSSLSSVFSFFLLPFVLDFTSSYISRGKFYLHLDDFVLNHSSDLNMEAGTFHMPLVVVSASAVILWIRVSLGVFSALTCSITVIQDVSLFLQPSSLKTEGDYSKCSIFNWLFFFFFSVNADTGKLG